jgi:outer membrane protein W
MFPILLGIRLDLLPQLRRTTIQPYASFGGGPYWLSDVNVADDRCDSEVAIKSELLPGLYCGAGFDFMLSGWFGLNLDMKYHFINFDTDHTNNGFEMGVGFVFRWGNFHSEY